MATSSSYDYTATAANIIDEALQIVGAVGEGGSANSSQQTDAIRKLNMMVKAWMADDLQLWVAQRATLFGALNQGTYAIGDQSGHDHVCSTYNKTELTAAAAASATSLTVSSITGISDTDIIGILLDDGSLHWDVVNGAPSGTTVTITTGLASAAASGNQVYNYATTAVIKRPQKILEMWRHVDDGTVNDESGYDIPIKMISREEFDERPYKASDGLPVEAYYNPLLDGGPAASNGELQMWPEPNYLTTLIQFRYIRPIQDVDAAANDMDFPQEWFEALTLGLAYRLSWNYGMPLQERYLLKKDAAEAKALVLSYSMEDTSVFLRPDYVAEQGF